MLQRETTVRLVHTPSWVVYDYRTPQLGVRMIDNHMPTFTNQASCADEACEPDWWHPIERGGNGNPWTRTPTVIKAKSICASCPALQECREYSLKYFHLYGIWGGMDRVQRTHMQTQLNLPTVKWDSTYVMGAWRSNNG